MKRIKRAPFSLKCVLFATFGCCFYFLERSLSTEKRYNYIETYLFFFCFVFFFQNWCPFLDTFSFAWKPILLCSSLNTLTGHHYLKNSTHPPPKKHLSFQIKQESCKSPCKKCINNNIRSPIQYIFNSSTWVLSSQALPQTPNPPITKSNLPKKKFHLLKKWGPKCKIDSKNSFFFFLQKSSDEENTFI